MQVRRVENMAAYISRQNTTARVMVFFRSG